MIIHDISLTVTPQTVTWDGTEQGFSAQWTSRVGIKGASSSQSVLTDGGAYAGTHMDAPLHFVPGGLTD